MSALKKTAQPALAPLAGALIIRRKELKLRQEDLAATLGISTRTIVRLEKGDSGVSLATLLSVTRALGLQLKITPADEPTVRLRAKRKKT